MAKVGGRPEVKNSFKIACPSCGDPILLHIIDSSQRFATSRCPTCKIYISYLTPDSIPNPFEVALYHENTKHRPGSNLIASTSTAPPHPPVQESGEVTIKVPEEEVAPSQPAVAEKPTLKPFPW